MKNGRAHLKKLEARMMRRFDEIEHEVERLRRTFGRAIGGLRGDVRLLFETIGELDQEIKDHTRNTRIHM